MLKFIFGSVGGIVLLIAFVISMTALGYWLKPLWLGMERNAYVESHQYSEARKDEMLKIVDNIEEVSSQIAGTENEKLIEQLEMQKDSLRSRLRRVAAKSKDVPGYVRKHL